VVGEPLVGVQAAVVEDGGLEEVDHVFVLDVLWAIAGDIEGREACGVLGELVLWSCQLCLTFLLHARLQERQLTPQRSWFGEFCAIQYVFM